MYCAIRCGIINIVLYIILVSSVQSQGKCLMFIVPYNIEVSLRYIKVF